jgi:hypothetical protein
MAILITMAINTFVGRILVSLARVARSAGELSVTAE